MYIHIQCVIIIIIFIISLHCDEALCIVSSPTVWSKFLFLLVDLYSCFRFAAVLDLPFIGYTYRNFRASSQEIKGAVFNK